MHPYTAHKLIFSSLVGVPPGRFCEPPKGYNWDSTGNRPIKLVIKRFQALVWGSTE